MLRYIAGLVVGATGALIGVYCAAALLPATREERPRDPLPGRRDPTVSHYDWRPQTVTTGDPDVQWSYTVT